MQGVLKIKALSLRRRHPFGFSANELRRQRHLRREIKRIVDYGMSHDELQLDDHEHLEELIIAHLECLQELQTLHPTLEFEERMCQDGNVRKYFFDRLSKIESQNLR